MSYSDKGKLGLMVTKPALKWFLYVSKIILSRSDVRQELFPNHGSIFSAPTHPLLGVSALGSPCAARYARHGIPIPRWRVLYVAPTRQSATTESSPNLQPTHGALHSTRCSRDRESAIPMFRKDNGMYNVPIWILQLSEEATFVPHQCRYDSSNASTDIPSSLKREDVCAKLSISYCSPTFGMLTSWCYASMRLP